MKIREAVLADVPALCCLLDQLGCPVEEGALAERLRQFSLASMSAVFVYDLLGRAAGVVVLHLVPQLVLGGDVVLISCLVVERLFRGTGIGAELEEFACTMARKDKAVGIAFLWEQCEAEALHFFERQGYRGSGNYRFKTL